MRLLKTSMADRQTAEKGFTLLEMLIVIGIMTMLGSLALIVSMDSYRGYAFRGERDGLVDALQKARSQSMNNMCFGSSCVDGRPHGVFVSGSSNNIFQGASYAARDSGVDEVLTRANQSIHITGGEVVFKQLSGEVAVPIDFTVSDDGGHTSVVSINSEGRISWTN